MRSLNGPYVPYRMPLRGLPHPFARGFGRLGDAASTKIATTTVSAGAAIAAGAAAGSVVGPVGTAVGALAAIVSTILTPSPNTAAHIGSWDSQLVSALAQLPNTVAGIGRQIPWNEDSHGLVQYLEALLACGQYMAWDNSLITNYDVCAHWAMALSTAAQTVATAVCQNKSGASVTVQITSAPGGPVGPAPFTFTNPAINSGPEAVTDAVIMGSKGVMTWLFSRWQIAGTAALSKQYATEMGSNTPATKVYAMMVDYVAGSLNIPDTIPATPVPDVTAVSAAASTAAKTVAATPAPTVHAPPSGFTIVSTVSAGPMSGVNLGVGPIYLVTAPSGGQFWWNAGTGALLTTGGVGISQATLTAAEMPPTAPTVAAQPAPTTAAVASVTTTPTAAQPVTVPACPTPVATTSSGSTVTDSDIANLISALQTSGASQADAVTSALDQLESAGVDTSSAPVQAAVQSAVAPTGLSTTEILLIGGGIIALVLLLKK